MVLAVAAVCVATGIAQATEPTLDEAKRRLIESRAVEAVIWGMPAVNTELMRQEMLKAGGKVNEIVYWGKPLSGVRRKSQASVCCRRAAVP
jgi:hypothetical protein